MRAFGIFSIIAAFSAALSVSAAPVAPGDLSLTPGVAQGVTFPPNVPNVAGGIPKRDVALSGFDIVPRTDVKSLPEIIIAATAEVKVVVEKLDVVLAGELDVTVIVGLLVEIKGILVAALAAVKLLAGLKLEVILALDGKVLAVAELAVYLVAFLELIVAIIVKVVAVVNVDICIQACIDISVVLAAFLGAIFVLVGGLLVIVLSLCAELILVIKAHATIFVALIAVLGL